MLISDPDTDKAAAAANVRVGHFFDHDQIGGLAHFCEHMLFLGSERYPEEDDYHKFVQKNGGFSNAFTAMEDTNYHFEINKDHLEPALDRFAQFFIAPLFTQSCTDREMQAVHSEHQNNLMTDFWRVFQLMKTTANQNHPFHKFGTGSLETLSDIPKKLGIDVRSELLKFHNQFYSANLITVAILGREELDVLENWAREKFSAVENKNVVLPSFSHVPVCEKQHVARMFKIVPVKDLKEVNILFPMPSPRAHYLKKPLNYYSHLIGHEGIGSAFAHLKHKGWVTSLSSGPMFNFTDQTFFSIAIEMTDEGEDHYLEIVKTIFQYIDILRREGVKRWIYDEQKDLAEIQFRFKEKPSASDYVTRLAENMQKYAPEHVISGDFLCYEYDLQLLEETINWLVPENCIIQYISKRTENEPELQEERWYGTKFTVQPFSDELLQSLRNPPLNDELALPQRNEFIPHDFSIKTLEENGADLATANDVPQLVLETKHIKLWHKLDQKFQQPKAIVIHKLTTPMQFATPQSFIMANLFSQMIKDRLNEYAYLAEIAGLNYNIQNHGTEGISLTLRGYNDKMPVLRSRIFEELIDVQGLKRERFEILKEKLYREYRNHLMEQPYQHVLYNERCAFNSKIYTLEDLIKIIPEIDFEKNFLRFVPALLMSLQIEVLAHGNITREEAIRDMKAVEQLMCDGKFGLLPAQIPFDSVVKLEEPKTDYIYQKNGFNVQDANSSIGIVYQIGLRNIRNDMLLGLLEKVLSAKYFDELRTKQQIGYIVFSRIYLENNVSALSLLLQSSDRSPKYMLEKSDAFIQSFFEVVRDDMDNDEIQEYVQAMIDERKQPDKRLSTETTRYWREINARQYRFDRRDAQIEVLGKITKSDLIEFYEKYILLQSDHCRRFVGQVSSAKHELEMGEITHTAAEVHKRRTVFVKDLVEFKRQMPLFPGFIKY